MTHTGLGAMMHMDIDYITHMGIYCVTQMGIDSITHKTQECSLKV